MPDQNANYLSSLHQLLNEQFSLPEIQALCLDLNIDYESVAGEEKPSRLWQLLIGLARNGRLPELLTLLAEKRPKTVWPPLPTHFQLPQPLQSGSVPTNSNDNIHGDKIGQDKIAVDSITAEAVATGANASVIFNKGYTPTELAELIDQLIRRSQAQQTDADFTSEELQNCHKQSVLELVAPRYQLDSRFVQITLLVDHGAEAQGIRFTPDSERKKYNSLANLLAEIDDRALVLLGKPGSGKTTLLRRLQLENAWAELENPTGRVAFFVPLNSYRQPAPNQLLPEPLDWLAAEWQIRHPRLPEFRTLYASGKLLLLLDGLNEMPHKDKADYRDRVGRWQTFWQQTWQYGNTLVFSCRSLDYSASLSGELAVVRQTQVEPLSADQIEEFLRLHLAEQTAEDAWEALRHDPQRLNLFGAPFFLRLLVDQIATTGTMPAGQAALLTGFVRRTLYREIAERRHHLFAPGRLLSEDDCQQSLQNVFAAPYDLPDEGDLIPSLEQLAYQMQAGRPTEEKGLVRAKTRQAQKWLPPENRQAIIEAGCQLNILDKDLAKREITFYHQLIQEYFAARVLAEQPEPERLAVPWQAADVTPTLDEAVAELKVSDPLPRLPATGWEETALLAAAICPNQEQFVRDLMTPNLPLAARCAAAVEVTVSPRLRRQLQDGLIERINNPQADLRARIVAAEALGELGDPRFERRSGPHGDYLLPPLATVAAGDYPLGSDDSGYSDEKPAHTVPLAGFEMAIFPLTNVEYRLFMQAGGYEDEQWWQTEAARAWRRGEGSSEGQKQNFRDVFQMLQGMTEESIRQAQATPEQIDGWLEIKSWSEEKLENTLEEWFPGGKIYRQPEYWEDSRFNHPAQPVVGLTWFEAQAYCAWLSAQTGELYTLPSEAEWEAAARGQVGRNYAWGKEYSSSRCNTFETHIRATTPVGVFPNGRTPETNIADLSGNVWEWTSTIWGSNLQKPDFPYPYDAQDGRENPTDATSRRVVRGGSWNRNLNGARGASRNSSRPGDRYNGLGCRLVRRSPSQ